MKKLLFTSMLAICWRISIAQMDCFAPCSFNFEDSIMNPLLHINSQNVWQIGVPNKTVFTAAYSTPNVIVTDTISPYPINDTSSFSLIYVGGSGFLPHTAVIGGYYYADTDSLSDYGIIEFSPDNGMSWYNILDDTIYYDTLPSTYVLLWEFQTKPVFTGKSNGWQYFYINIASLGHLLNAQYGDTFHYRFTFISDSLQTNKDGLMFDNLIVIDYAEPITYLPIYFFQSKTYPNPAKNQLLIDFDNDDHQDFELEVFNALGQLLYSEKNIRGNRIELNLSDFPQGAYYYNLRQSTNGKWSKGKFVRRE